MLLITHRTEGLDRVDAVLRLRHGHVETIVDRSTPGSR